MDGVERIAAERRRQVEKEGWSAEHDDGHDIGELAAAAAVYALHASGVLNGEELADLFEAAWPWVLKDWKPGKPDESEADAMRCLAKAGALIAAEMDRRERAAQLLAPPAGGEEE